MADQVKIIAESVNAVAVCLVCVDRATTVFRSMTFVGREQRGERLRGQFAWESARSGLPAHRQMVFSEWNTMGVAKFAISMPTETMSRVDRAAKRLGMTRSRYIAVVLDRVAGRERDAAISRKVDKVLAELDGQDIDSAAHLLAARRDEGTEWSSVRAMSCGLPYPRHAAPRQAAGAPQSSCSTIASTVPSSRRPWSSRSRRSSNTRRSRETCA